jgi:ribonuclease J
MQTMRKRGRIDPLATSSRPPKSPCSGAECTSSQNRWFGNVAAVGLLPATLDRERPLDGVLISHPHQDHYGLLEETPAHWPVYSGAATERLMQLTAGIFGQPMQRDFRSWTTGQANQIGPFKVTPYLTDHSAFDAHMLLIEAAGKRVLYSGDFRTHGRKSKLVERLMGLPPADIDVLLMEGTNLGSDKPCITETDLEHDYVELFRSTKGRVFVAWSAQNIDRTVTLYRACLKTKRTLVIDLYTAEVLDVLAEHGRIPQLDWASIKVVITSAFSRLYKRKGDEAFVTRMAGNGISAKALAQSPEKWVVMVRPSLIKDYEPAGVSPTADDAWSYAMWRGYLKNEDGQRLQNWFDQGGATAKHLHTSGHASPSDLRAFANAMKPKTMVPIHGVAWDTDVEGFPPITRLVDGQPLTL